MCKNFFFPFKFRYTVPRAACVPVNFFMLQHAHTVAFKWCSAHRPIHLTDVWALPGKTRPCPGALEQSTDLGQRWIDWWLADGYRWAMVPASFSFLFSRISIPFYGMFFGTMVHAHMLQRELIFFMAHLVTQTKQLKSNMLIRVTISSLKPYGQEKQAGSQIIVSGTVGPSNL